MGLFSFKKKKQFSREFPVVGTMSAMATKEEKCQQWSKIMPFFVWDKARFVLQSDITSQSDIDIMIGQYTMAKEHEPQILAAIKKHPEYTKLVAKGIDPLANEDDIWVAAHLQEHDISPCIEVSYNTKDYYIWFAIQDGELSEFLPSPLVDLPK